jgi:hypothetical protein
VLQLSLAGLLSKRVSVLIHLRFLSTLLVSAIALAEVQVKRTDLLSAGRTEQFSGNHRP